MEWRNVTENDLVWPSRRDTGFDKHYLCLYNRRFRNRRRLAQGWEFEVSETRFYDEVPEVNKKKPRPEGYKKKTVTWGQIQHFSPFFMEIIQRQVPDPVPWTEEEALIYLEDHMDFCRRNEFRHRKYLKREAEAREAARIQEENRRIAVEDVRREQEAEARRQWEQEEEQRKRNEHVFLRIVRVVREKFSKSSTD